MAKVVAKKKILYGILQEQVEKTANFRKAEFDFRKKEIDRKEFFEYDERSSKERTFGKKKNEFDAGNIRVSGFFDEFGKSRFLRISMKEVFFRIGKNFQISLRPEKEIFFFSTRRKNNLLAILEKISYKRRSR